MEAHDLSVVLHVHDDLVVEAPIGTITPDEFQRLALEAVPWADGLPLAGKARTAHCYLEPPEEPLQPQLDNEQVTVETVLDTYLEDARTIVTAATDAEENGDEDEDEDAFLDDLEPSSAPLRDFVSLPLTDDNKVSCPFHEDPTPSLQIYPDHWHCFGCTEHGNRIDWLVRVEGMNRAEAIAAIQDWEPRAHCAVTAPAESKADKIATAMTLWNAANSLLGSMGERYLSETRCIDVGKLPADIHESLRFHPRCPFGVDVAPCILALMRDPLNDVPVGIHRIGLKTTDGKIDKLDRKALGMMGVVKLWPANGVLTVGEGLETVLAAATRLPHEAPLIPAWSAVSSGGLAKLPVIPGVRSLTLLIDNDLEGLAAAAKLEQRWRAAGREVTQLLPDTPGADFNDVVLEFYA
jgi:Toprim domain/CHC2 zinc finger